MSLFKFGLKDETVDLLTTLAVEKLAVVLEKFLRDKKISVSITIEDKYDGRIRK